MTAFKFRLEPVVSVKKRVEDERKTALARARDDLTRKEHDLVNLCDHRESCQKHMVADSECGNLDIAKKLIYYAYMEKLTEEIASHACAVEESKAEVETKLDLLLESSKEKRALEKLRERLKARHVSDEKRAEQAALDDAAGQIHARKSGNDLQWKKE